MKTGNRMRELVLSIREEIFPAIIIVVIFLAGVRMGLPYVLVMDKYERSKSLTAEANKILSEGGASKMIINGRLIYLASKNTVNALRHHSKELSLNTRPSFQIVNPDTPVNACVITSSETSDKNNLVCNSSKGKIILGLEEGVSNIVFYENPLQNPTQRKDNHD